MIGLPASAARRQHEVEAAMLEDGRSLSALTDEEFQICVFHTGIVRGQLHYVHVLVAHTGVCQICCPVVVLDRGLNVVKTNRESPSTHAAN